MVFGTERRDEKGLVLAIYNECRGSVWAQFTIPTFAKY
jgi:hypothetical protein